MKTKNTLILAVELIEQNLTNPSLSIDYLAKNLYFSPYYFQRFFAASTQKSVGAYIRERRLTEAGSEIKQGASILDVAIKYCYESQESFSRAFKSFHAVTPGQAKAGGILSCCPKLNLQSLFTRKVKMDIKIEREQAFTIAVFERKFSPLTSKQEIPRFWDEFYDKGYQKSVPPMLGVCIDLGETPEDNAGEFIYGIGSIKEYCNSIPKGFKTYDVPSRLWGKFYTTGKMPDAIQNLWGEVLSWVDGSEYKIEPGFDFECYTEGDTTKDDYVSGIWVALEKK